MNKNRIIPALCAAALALILFGAAAQARAPFMPDIPPAQRQATPVFLKNLMNRLFGRAEQAQGQATGYYIKDDESFAENTRMEHFRPYNDQYLEFDMPVPRNWEVKDLTKEQTKTIDSSVIGDLVTMKSEMIGVFTAYVTVSLMPITEEMSAGSWLKHYIFSSGYALQQEVEEVTPYLARAYYTSIEDAKNIHTYIAAHVTGSSVVLARFDAPLQLQHYLHYFQKKMVDSISLTYPRTEPVEPQKTYTLSDALRFNYPTSWMPQNTNFSDMSRPVLDLVNKTPGGSVDGFIRIQAVRRSMDNTLAKEIERQREEFSNYMQLDATKLTSVRKAEGVLDTYIFARHEIYEAAYRKERMSSPELHLVILGSKEWYVFIYLLTPRQQDNLANWGHNTRVLQILLESIR